MFLLIVNYENDAERKRIDYAIERWSEKINISKPKGTIIVIDGKKESIDEFVEDLCSRLGKKDQKVEIHKISTYQPEISKNTKNIVYQTKEQKPFVEKFIDYLMVKLSASFEYSSKLGKIYTVYTRKGQAKLEIILQGKDNGTDIKIAVDGYGDVVNFIYDKIDSEINMFLGGS